MPEHSIQIRMPRFREAQSGSEAPQSEHLSFPGTSLRILETESGLLTLMKVRTFSSLTDP